MRCEDIPNIRTQGICLLLRVNPTRVWVVPVKLLPCHKRWGSTENIHTLRSLSLEIIHTWLPKLFKETSQKNYLTFPRNSFHCNDRWGVPSHSPKFYCMRTNIKPKPKRAGGRISCGNDRQVHVISSKLSTNSLTKAAHHNTDTLSKQVSAPQQQGKAFYEWALSVRPCTEAPT